MTLAYEPDLEGQLRALVRAGKDGLKLGDGIDLGAALHFGAVGHATIGNAKTPPQRAYATELGRAFSQRGAW